MTTFITTPTKIFPKPAIFPLSSTSPTVVCRGCSISVFNGTHLGLMSSNLPRPKARHFLGPSNSEIVCFVNALYHKHNQLEDIEAAEVKESQTDGSNLASLRLELRKECEYGDQFLVVGDHRVLGSWNPSNATPLTWSDGHMWSVNLELPVGKPIHYKFICKLSKGGIVWQPGSDRTIRLTEPQTAVTITDDWENQERTVVSTAKMQEELLVQKGSRKSEEEGLVTYDEGRVLVPGLKFQVVTEESLAKELNSTVQKSLVPILNVQKDEENGAPEGIVSRCF